MATVMTPGTPPNRSQKLTKQQHKEIIWAYQYAKKTESERTTLDTYRIWRDRNPDTFPGMNPKNLSNQRRFILRENKLKKSEINEIISDVASKLLECEIDDDPTKYIERHVPDTKGVNGFTDFARHCQPVPISALVTNTTQFECSEIYI